MTTVDAIAALLTDRKRLIESIVPIEDKDRNLVPFVLNPIQVDMLDNSVWRDVYVKPAQVGGTSIIMCDFLLDCLLKKGTTAVIISYDEFITGRLLRKAQAFYDNLKQRVPTLPRAYKKSTFEKTFIFEDRAGVKKGESSFYIASAKGFAMPRGEPIHDLLMDEVGFWPAGVASEAFAAALNRVPLRPGTKVRVLSTPNGEDNDFYDVYMAAKEGRSTGKSVFKAHFYPWFMLPEYTMVPDSEFVLPGDSTPILDDLTPDEILLMVHFSELGIELEEAHNKFRWRRYKLAEAQSLKRSGETRLLFAQEFPSDDVSCFLSAADEWYPHEEINKLARNCAPPTSNHLGADVWYPPEEGLGYLMLIDPGLGKKSESVAHVWTFTETEYKHCATFSGLYAGKEMVDKCVPIARWYNEATIANEDALDITAPLVWSGYPNLYYRTDPVTGRVGKDVGWQTNPATKVFMCNALLQALPLIVSHDIRWIEQSRNIREGKSRGRLIPVSVGADDHHDCAALAAVCRGSIQVERGFVGAKGWSAGWG